MRADELSHIIKQHVAQAMVDQKAFIYGHIANYDPVAHKVRLILPSLRDENGRAILTPWMPFGTTGAGQGGGFQYHPFTGATAANPTAGEQCMVMLLDKNQGVAAASVLFYGPGDATPASGLPAGAAPFAAGEYLLGQKSGSFVRLHASGDVEVYAIGKAIVTALGSVVINAPAVMLGALGQTLYTLCNKLFFQWANGHTHKDNGAGPPVTPPPADGLTTTTTAG